MVYIPLELRVFSQMKYKLVRHLLGAICQSEFKSSIH
jgi:hypothetical protein